MQPTSNARPTLRFALDAAAKLLAEGPHPARARRDAETLLLDALRQNPPQANLAWLLAHDADPLAPDQAAAFCDAIERRLAGEPIQYITGEAEFYGLSFHVDRDVLIPRPETELLVEKAIELAGKLRRSSATSSPRIVDIGAGSGAIAVALAHEVALRAKSRPAKSPQPRWSSPEPTPRATPWPDRIRFLEGDLLAPVAGEQFDLIVSNPPYVPEGDRATLDVEVRNYRAGAGALRWRRRPCDLPPPASRIIPSPRSRRSPSARNRLRPTTSRSIVARKGRLRRNRIFRRFSGYSPRSRGAAALNPPDRPAPGPLF